MLKVGSIVVIKENGDLGVVVQLSSKNPDCLWIRWATDPEPIWWDCFYRSELTKLPGSVL